MLYLCVKSTVMPKLILAFALSCLAFWTNYVALGMFLFAIFLMIFYAMLNIQNNGLLLCVWVYFFVTLVLLVLEYFY